MVQVKVSEGILEGDILDNEYGGKIYSFKGIPYAQPPIGDLRFKAPQPSKPWKGVRRAKEHGPICCQMDIYMTHKIEGSEDCLYLNVYTPDISPSKPLPVMFWIHGGAFMSGNGNMELYGPEFLVRHEVVLVTINYRLEVLGFLCLDNEEIPGNAGMKDQVAALRWVQKNIVNFGGDPNNVTIFGESAGGMSVSFHLISPMSKGLFKRAISQSGICTSWWGTQDLARERAIEVAKSLGCESEDDEEIVSFLKSVPAESLTDIKAALTYNERAKTLRTLFFTIVSEKKFGNNERFFYGNVYDALKNGIHEGVEVMNGYVDDEGLIILAGIQVETLIDEANHCPEFFVPEELTKSQTTYNQLEIGKKMKRFYFPDNNVNKDNCKQLVKFIGTNLFVNGAVTFHKICAKHNKNTIYMYKFSCNSERNIMAHIVGVSSIIKNRPVVCHGDDLHYLFPFKVAQQEVDTNSRAFKMINTVSKLWTNFAKFGNPTPDNSLGVTWKPYTQENEHFLTIGEKLVLGTSPDQEEIKFWEDIYKEYDPNLSH